MLKANLNCFLGVTNFGGLDGTLALQLGPFLLVSSDTLTAIVAPTDTDEDLDLQHNPQSGGLFRFYEERAAVIAKQVSSSTDTLCAVETDFK